MVKTQPPRIASPPILAVGKLYDVTHKCFGRFIARAVEPSVGWCGFCVIEGNAELSRLGFSTGEYIELTAQFYRATPLESRWNRQAE